jgi:hypothetical protein
MEEGHTASIQKAVTVVPQGSSMMDFTNWKGPVSLVQRTEGLSKIFENDLADLAVTSTWQFNGQFIGNFNVVVDGTLDVLKRLGVVVTTFPASLDGDGVVELPYQIAVRFDNGKDVGRSTTFRAVARGDGGSRTLS